MGELIPIDRHEYGHSIDGLVKAFYSLDQRLVDSVDSYCGKDPIHFLPQDTQPSRYVRPRPTRYINPEYPEILAYQKYYTFIADLTDFDKVYKLTIVKADTVCENDYHTVFAPCVLSYSLDYCGQDINDNKFPNSSRLQFAGLPIPELYDTSDAQSSTHIQDAIIISEVTKFINDCRILSAQEGEAIAASLSNRIAKHFFKGKNNLQEWFFD